METIRTVGDAIDYAEKTIEALRLKAEELDPSARPAFETKAADVVRDLSQMVPDPDLRARFGRELAEPFPPGSGDTRLSDAMSSGQDSALEVLKADAAGATWPRSSPMRGSISQRPAKCNRTGRSRRSMVSWTACWTGQRSWASQRIALGPQTNCS